MKFTIFSITEPKWMVGFLSVVSVMFHTFTSAQSTVEGFAGGAVTLPCTVSIQGVLEWYSGTSANSGTLILIKPVNGSPTPSESAWKDVVSLVEGTNNMKISSLEFGRDNDRPFKCRGTSGGGPQETRVRVLALIEGAKIGQADQGPVTVNESVPKTLTCSVTGNPNPSPSYSWSVDNVQVSTQGSSYSLTANRSMNTVKCTATNLYSNGTILSRVAAEAGLNVQYLDKPSQPSSVTVIENDRVSLLCSAEGNPPPTFEWTRSESVDVKISSAKYTIDNVQRSDAGQYICTVTNTVGGRQATPTTVTVQYPPDVNVTYDGNSRTLTCTAQGVPNTYTFSVWEHRLGGTLIRTLGTAQNSYSFSHALTYEDTGDYVCSVTNGIKSLQTGKTNLAPPTAAVFQNQTKIKTIGIGKTEMISVPFYTTASGNVQVKWEKSGESTALKSHQEEKGEVSLLVYGEMVSIEGTVTVLTLTDVSESDEGNYTVTVTSNINGVSEDKRISFYVNVTIITETPGGGTTGEQGANLGLYIGSAAGGVALVMIIIFGAIFCWRRSHPRGRSDSKEEKTSVKLSQSEQLCPEGRGFSGSQWKEPDAEVVVNDLYESASFSRDLPPQDKRPPKPARTFEHNSVRVKDSQPSGAEPEMVMEENTLYDSADPKPGVKKNVATKPQKAVKPMRPAKPDKPQLPIDDSYELTGFSNTPGANNNNTPAKRPVLNYQEVSFDRTKDPSRVNTPRSPTNYSDISFKNKH